jgi:hypothetical protein
MSDSIFKPVNSNAMLLSQLKRVSGTVPYLRRTNQVASTSPVKSPADTAVNQVAGGSQYSGTISSSQGLQLAGNNYLFYVHGNFGFTSTPNSITIYWDGTNGSMIFAIKRVDGTSFTVPKGTLTISGLAADTQYGFLPFNCLSNQNNLSFCAGDAGTPRFAFSPTVSSELKATANQTQNLSSNEAITKSFIYYSTAATGTTAGDGLPGDLSPYSQTWTEPA